MLQIGLFMLIGAYATHQAESLPTIPWLISIGILAVAMLPIRTMRAAGAVLLGVLLTSMTAMSVVNSRLDARLEGHVVEFSAVVEEIPSVTGDSLRITVVPSGDDLPKRIRLSWYDTDRHPQPGEQWRFNARLRAPRGFANPHGFDYEGWLFRQRIAATGYVVSGARIAGQDESGPVSRLRQRYLARIRSLLPDDAARAVLAAITVGVRQDITRDQWSRYARTGTSHLMAISGLHIGLAAAGFFYLVRLLAAPFVCGRNVRDIAALAASAGASAYALLSGLAVPAQRALLMVLFVSATMLLRRQQSPFRILSIAAITVFVADPLAILAPGFQLSFLAVFLLLYVGQQSLPLNAWPDRPVLSRAIVRISRLGILQCALLLGLLPVTVLQFGRIAWIAPPVNLLVLPVFNLLTVPLALLAVVFDGPLQAAGDQLLRLSWHSVHLVLAIVSIASSLPGAELTTLPVHNDDLIILWAAALWVLLPPGFPGRALAWIATLAIVVQKPAMVPADCVDLHVLDVGQGLSVVMQTQSHVAVFDTGPSFRSGSDTATLVLAPFLRSLGVRRLDKLIVSHADLDHAGGVDSVLEAFPVDEVLFGEMLAIESDASPAMTPCAAGQSWHWDGVEFKILYPEPTSAQSGNNASCVLQLEAGDNRALLTGDIERPVELLLSGHGTLRPSTLVVVPHHGSRTSSSASFVELLQADFAIVSAGFGNRWGLPRPDVVSRWEQTGARVLTTADSGAVSQRVCGLWSSQAPREQRRAERRYWHAPR